MDIREKRIFLRLCSKSEQQKAAIEKLDNYDKRRYNSLTDYIVQAILAYDEPVVIGEDRLRQILREELGEDRKTIQEPTVQEQDFQEENKLEAYQEETSRKKEEEIKAPDSEVQPDELSEAARKEKEAAPDIDDTAIEFMKELGIM